jgi:Fic family protein
MDVEALKKSPIGNAVPIKVPEPGLIEATVPYWAYVPEPLAASPQLTMASINIASKAAMAVARLDQALGSLPRPDLLLRPIIRREARSTSALEGTYAEFDAVLEADFIDDKHMSSEQREVHNFVRATERASERLKELPIGRRLIGELQSIIVRGTDGDTYDCGDLRKRQVYIGPKNRPVQEARFVPTPPGSQLESGFDAWEGWVNSENDVPIVVKMALAHYQFETLHPYADGNGRLGRLIGLLQLIEDGSLATPSLNLSPWFEARKDAYMDSLLQVTFTGDFDRWVQFYATAVLDQAQEGVRTIQSLVEFKELTVANLRSSGVRGSALEIAENLIGYPVLDVTTASYMTGKTFESANNAVARLVNEGVLREITGRRINRLFICYPVMEIVNQHQTAGFTPVS